MWMGFALLSAVCFGLRGILYHWTSQQKMNRNLMLFGVFFSGALLSLASTLIAGERWTPATLIGLLMGIFSFGANASMYKGFAVGKASIVAILSGLAPVVVVTLAFVFWHETLSYWQLLAFGIILASVIMIRYSNDLSLKHLQGAQWGLLAMLLFGLNDLSSKQSILTNADTFPTLSIMFLTGSAFFCINWLIGKRNANRSEPHQEEGTMSGRWNERNTFLWGMVVGITNVGGMFTILLAFHSGVTGLVSAVVALNVLLILLYTRLFTKEKLKRLELAGMSLSFLGILVLHLMK